MPYEKLYGVRPDVSHLHTFGALCAIVEPKERLKMLEERATMCFFAGYKYGGGGYRVWDPNRLNVVESREDSSPSPTLRDLALTTTNEGEPLT